MKLHQNRLALALAAIPVISMVWTVVVWGVDMSRVPTRLDQMETRIAHLDTNVQKISDAEGIKLDQRTPTEPTALASKQTRDNE